MLCLWHTANSADGLNLKALAHAFSQFDENLGTRAVPSGADGLFHKKKHRDSIILGQIVRQSVLELNLSDGGNRTFILCTNNQNDICSHITYPRLKTIISGIRENGSTYSNGIPANLKYYRTDFVSKYSDSLTDELLDHIKEMIQLEHGINLDGSQYLLVLTDEEADALEQHWDEYKDVKALYVSRNVLFTTEQNMLFGDVDIHIIPDDYFKFELQEVGEAW